MSKRQESTQAEQHERALIAELMRIYGDADAAYAGHNCPGSTECCRFNITGRQPYVTTIEVAALRAAIAARGGPLRPRRQALPLAPRGDEGTCALLTRDAKCVVYASRPLGCRTFWCGRASSDGAVPQRRLNELVRSVRELAERHAPGATQGRPLCRALGLARTRK